MDDSLPLVQHTSPRHVRAAPSSPHSSLARPPTGLLSQAAIELISVARPSSSLVQQRAKHLGGSLAVCTKASGGASSGVSTSRGPSAAACRENIEKAKYAVQLERHVRTEARATISPCAGSGSLARFEGSREDTDARAESFLADVVAMDHQLTDLVRGARLERLADFRGDRELVEDGTEHNERGEGKYRRDADRKKRVQELSDPYTHRTIADRIEKRRSELEADSMPEVGVPMQRVDIVGSKGRERVALVDVRALQSRCQQLGEGATVQSLIERQRQRERQERLMATGKTSLLHASSSAPSIQSLSDAATLRGFSEQSHRERRIRVLAQKESNHIGGVLRKLHAMRSELPDTLPCGAEALKRHLERERHNGISKERDMMEKLVQKLEVSDADLNFEPLRRALSVASPTADELMRRHTTNNVSPSSSGTLRRVSSQISSNLLQPNSQRRCASRRLRAKGDAELSTGRRHPTCRHWVVLRMAVMFLMLQHTVARKTHAAQVLKCILSEVGEWTRLRTMARRTINSIRILQTKCSEFLVHKKSRCMALDEEWQRVEDHHLSIFFLNTAHKLVLDQKRKTEMAEAEKNAIKSQAGLSRSLRAEREAKQKADSFYRSMAEGIAAGDLEIDWRAFRIPAEARKHMISRFYMLQLRKRIRNQGNIISIIRTALQAHRDLERFFTESGAKNFKASQLSDQEEASTPTVHRPFWYMSEEKIIQFIGACAHILANNNPFQNHPALQEKPDNPMFVMAVLEPGPPQLLNDGECVPNLIPYLDQAVSRMVQRSQPDREVMAKWSSSLDARGATNLTDANRTICQGDQDKCDSHAHLDIDDLVAQFTPRFRELCEQQTLEVYQNLNNGNFMLPWQ